MFLYQDISRLIFIQLKLHNFFATPLFKFTNKNPINLSVSTNKERMYIAKTLFCVVYCLFQWIQIVYKISYFKAPQKILAVLANGSITVHFVVLILHFKQRHEIANLFNHFIKFERTYNGNKIKFNALN